MKDNDDCAERYEDDEICQHGVDEQTRWEQIRWESVRSLSSGSEESVSIVELEDLDQVQLDRRLDLTRQEFFNDSFVLGNMLGEGGFGTVYQCCSKDIRPAAPAEVVQSKLCEERLSKKTKSTYWSIPHSEFGSCHD